MLHHKVDYGDMSPIMNVILCSSCVPGLWCILGNVVMARNLEMLLRYVILCSRAPGLQRALGNVAEMCTLEVPLGSTFWRLPENRWDGIIIK